jgi:tetratricopeptide (TPR) repeat protein
LSSFTSFFLTLLIAVLITCGNFQYALAKVRSSGKNTVEPSKENLALGLARYKQKDFDGAIDSFLQSIYFNRSSYNPQAYYWLGLCYQEKKLDGKAIEALKKSIEQTIGKSPDAHLHLAQLYLRNDRLEEAAAEANQAWVEFQGKAPEAHNILGLIAERRGDWRGAEDQFLEALGEKKPWRYTEAWMNYAENLIKQKRWGDAIIQLRDMLNNDAPLKGLSPEQIYLDIGICLLAKGDHQGAMDNWHESLNYNPDNAMAHLQLALLLDSERHISSAIKEYKEYIRLSPDNLEVAKIKNQVLKLEQILKSTQQEHLITNTKASQDTDEYAQQPSTIQTKDKGSKTNHPASNKESGF